LSASQSVADIVMANSVAQRNNVEVVTLLQLSNRKPDAKIRIDIDLEDYYQIKDGLHGWF
jgi:hypothetical protein